MISIFKDLAATIKSIGRDLYHYFKPTSKVGVVRFGVLVIALITIVFFLSGENEPAAQPETSTRAVTVERVSSFNTGGELSLVGSVEAIDRAVIQAETGGRVTDVRAEPGDRVAAGAVLATLENASQYAAVLQAEGAYEAAVAAAAQSDISVSSAQTSRVAARNAAVDAFRSAYTTTNNVILNNIDDFFSNPDAQTLPGLRLEGFGYTSGLNKERVAFQDILSEWRDESNTLTTNDDLQAALTDAEMRLNRVREMIDIFIILLNEEEPSSVYSEDDLATYSATFASLRATLDAELLAIENARTSLENAEESLRRAEISGTGGTVSTANANVKQALGSLRAAQAIYAQTILRSPIAGEVQSITVHVGDYVTAQTQVATIANNNALEVTAYVTKEESERFALGDTVMIEDGIPGIITSIAPSVDPSTGKVEVRMQSESEELQNGDTVRLSIEGTVAEIDTDAPIVLPITALKVETDRIIVFTISDDSTLVAHEIVEGPLLGNSIVIERGVTSDMEIVVDARGLNEGDHVEVLH